MVSPKVSQLQLLQQNLQNLMQQKQQLQNQLIELDSALTELKTTPQAYRIMGKVMIAAPVKELSRDLMDKKEMAEVHLRNMEKQEEKLNSKIEQLQAEVMKELKP